ncbi:MAG TPA: ATP-binding cassette domain-containing protein [Marmoricola sp.]|nr:ATP-binding cassette domain-containing protein [Marmoricola sp.]
MIEWQHLTFRYEGADRPTLTDVSLTVPESELVLVAGRTGSGKSTLLRTVNGLVPRFTGGHLAGDVLVDGRRVRDRAPRELADLVGFVGQDPLATFVTDVVEEELAYGMEQLGLSSQTMRRRVEETLDLLGIADLRSRPLRSLSGGQQQRVAIGAVFTMHPHVLVLDEPTSALDPTAAEDVLSTLARLVEDLGLTVLLAEHRMERVVPFADRLLLVEDGRVRGGQTAELLAGSPVAPPVVELGRLAGWEPLPLSVREARRRTSGLRAALGEPRPSGVRAPGAPVLQARDVVVRYGRTVAVREVALSVASGQVVALMGRNGSGKSSLLWALQGAGRRDGGTVEVEGTDPAQVSPARARELVGLVPQNAGDLLYLETVDDECAAADQQAGAEPGSCRDLLGRLAPGIDGGRHPRDLSEGQRLSLVLALVLTARPRVVALDEPTRGLDYTAKEQLATVVSGLAAAGHGVVVATHDVEFVASVADQVVVMAGGEVVSAGVTAQVLAESPAFAPQMSKILGAGWLTVDQVREALV